jgi:hypothetical protein
MVGKFREFCCLSLLYLMCPPGAGDQDRLVQEYIEIASNTVTSVESQIPPWKAVAHRANAGQEEARCSTQVPRITLDSFQRPR